mgnify:CR=1 FL=1
MALSFENAFEVPLADKAETEAIIADAERAQQEALRARMLSAARRRNAA